MNQDICVAVAIQSKGRIIDDNATEQERPADDCAVSIVSFANTEGGWMHGNVSDLDWRALNMKRRDGGQRVHCRRIAKRVEDENSALGRQFLLIFHGKAG